MFECNHQVERSRWREYLDYEGNLDGEWEYYTESFFEDIDTGRMQCTRCGAVKYYTRQWREHWEGK